MTVHRIYNLFNRNWQGALTNDQCGQPSPDGTYPLRGHTQ